MKQGAFKGAGVWRSETGRATRGIAVELVERGECAGSSKVEKNLPGRPLPAQDKKPLVNDGGNLKEPECDEGGEGAWRWWEVAGSGRQGIKRQGREPGGGTGGEAARPKLEIRAEQRTSCSERAALTRSRVVMHRHGV